MVDYFTAIVFGVIQGVTEFLPVSSSGHLIVLHEILGFTVSDNVAFDAVLHMGTFFALAAFFRKEIVQYFIGFVQGVRYRRLYDPYFRISLFIIFSTIPAAVCGYFFEDIIISVFRRTVVVALMLIAVGILLYLIEKYSQKSKEMREMSFFDAIIVGLAQVLAFVPGVSRSGITIIAGLSRKLKTRDAASFSFLLSLLITLGAGIKKIFDVEWVWGNESVFLTLGFAASVVSGFICLKLFLKYLLRHSLAVFACYRIMLGTFILMWFVLRT